MARFDYVGVTTFAEWWKGAEFKTDFWNEKSKDFYDEIEKLKIYPPFKIIMKNETDYPNQPLWKCILIDLESIIHPIFKKYSVVGILEDSEILKIEIMELRDVSNTLQQLVKDLPDNIRTILENSLI